MLNVDCGRVRVVIALKRALTPILIGSVSQPLPDHHAPSLLIDVVDARRRIGSPPWFSRDASAEPPRGCDRRRACCFYSPRGNRSPDDMVVTHQAFGHEDQGTVISEGAGRTEINTACW